MNVRKPVILKPYGSSEWERQVFASVAEVRGVEYLANETLAGAIQEISWNPIQFGIRHLHNYRVYHLKYLFQGPKGN